MKIDGNYTCVVQFSVAVLAIITFDTGVSSGSSLLFGGIAIHSSRVIICNRSSASVFVSESSKTYINLTKNLYKL